MERKLLHLLIRHIGHRAIWHSDLRPERQIALKSKLKTTGYASTAPNPIIPRYHFGSFVH